MQTHEKEPFPTIETEQEKELDLNTLQEQVAETEAHLSQLAQEEAKRAQDEDEPQIEAIKLELDSYDKSLEANIGNLPDIHPKMYRYTDGMTYYCVAGDSMHIDTGNFGGGGADARDIRVRDNLLNGEFAGQVHFLPSTEDTKKIQGEVSSETVRSTSKKGILEASTKMIGDLLTYIDQYKKGGKVKVGEGVEIQLPSKLWGRTNEQMALLGKKMEGAVTVIDDTTEFEEKIRGKDGKLKKAFPGQNILLGKRKKEQEKPFTIIDIEGFDDEMINELSQRYKKQTQLLQRLIDKEQARS